MQNYDTTHEAFSDETGIGEISLQDDPQTESAPAVLVEASDLTGPEETVAQQRRRQRIALVEEFGGHTADIKQVAVEAKRRGMYSPRTNRGDVELCLIRTWKLRNRDYGR